MNAYLQRTSSPAPLAVFRLVFGLLIFAGVVRFWCKGWIHDLYIQPKYFFPFFGFEFVKPLGEYTYVLFALCAASALLVAIGYYYRVGIVTLFLSFTYIELIDKSTYLNHYYFVSMICLLMIFLPANATLSVDAYRNRSIARLQIPRWSVDSIKVFVCMLYVFAGMAKINSDWLLEAQPLRIWLPAKNDLPLIGSLFNYGWVPFAFSWFGCLYDLTIPFLLMNRRTRLPAYFAVVVFHLMTSVLFPIGMFPYIMIATALIFFPENFHAKIVSTIKGWLRLKQELIVETKEVSQRFVVYFLVIFFILQAVLPFRYLAYPDELFWTEEGYRFSWRVMLMEKAGYAQFIVKDNEGRQEVVDNTKFLTPLQEKMVATQPDMILHFAHILRDHYSELGFESPQVFVDSYVALNGRLGRPLVSMQTDLAAEEDSFKHKSWILPFGDEIKGF